MPHWLAENAAFAACLDWLASHVPLRNVLCLHERERGGGGRERM